MQRDSILRDAASVTLASSALVLLGLVVWQLLLRDGSSLRSNGGWHHVEDWERISAEGRLLGMAESPVTIVEFGDVQSRLSRVLHQRIDSLQRAFPTHIAVKFHHFPQPSRHPLAPGAGMALECAGDQGRFHRLLDLLLESQDSLASRSWVGFGEAADVRDIDEFQRCIEEERYLGRVMKDVSDAEGLGLEDVPAVLVNSQLYKGPVPHSELRRAVLAILRPKRTG